MATTAKPSLFVQFKPKPGDHESVRRHLEALIAVAQEEAGTEVYALHVAPDGGLWLYERYSDDNAQRAHSENDTAQRIIGECRDMVEDVQFVPGSLLAAK